MGRENGNDENLEGEQFRKLFIGGLDYRTTDESLKTFYEKWGEIVDVVVMKHPYNNQKSRGFGFVTYAASSMVDEAMKNRPHKIDGREVDSKRAVPRDESGAATGSNINVKKMYIGGLKEQTEAELKEYFSEFGNIVNVNIITDKKTGNRKGYAFIEYDDYDPIDKALLRKDHTVGGKSLSVKKAVSKDSNEKGGRGSGRSGGGGGGGRSSGSRGGFGPWSGSGNSGGGGGGGWGGGAPNGYGGSGPWESSGGGSSSWGTGGSGGGGWGDQYSSSWNGSGSGYQQGYGGGPVRSNYSSGSRSTPYGGGGYGGSGPWSGGRY